MVVDTLKSAANSTFMALIMALVVIGRGYVQSRLSLPPPPQPAAGVPRANANPVSRITPNNFPNVNTQSLFY